MDNIKVLKIAGNSNINAVADAAFEEIKQNMAVNIDCIGIKASYQAVKVLILLTEKLVKMSCEFYIRPYYIKVDTLTQEHDIITKTAIRWTLIVKKSVLSCSNYKDDEIQKRILSVYYSYTGNKKVPQIRLQGKWLKELGFAIGEKIIVLPKNGIIEIKIDSAENNVGLIKKDNKD